MMAQSDKEQVDNEQTDKVQAEKRPTWEEYYVEDQVLITGTVNNIDRVIESMARVLSEELQVDTGTRRRWGNGPRATLGP